MAIYIGIDPDVNKSGVCIYDSKEKTMDICALDLFDLVDTLKALNNKFGITVIIEAGWLNKVSNYHKSKNLKTSNRIAKDVGRNHQVGRLIEYYCKKNNIKYLLSRPTKSKVSIEYFRKVTKYKGKLNKDMVDAAMLVYGI